MTEQEKREQRAMLLLEYQEAEDNLAHIREKAARSSRPFTYIGIWLERAAHPSRVEMDRTAMDDQKRDAQIRANLETYRNINFDEALSLMDELVQAQELVRRLAARKAELGLK